jgi:hypothetical protein
MNFTKPKAIVIATLCLVFGQSLAQSDSLPNAGYGLFPKWEPKGLPSLQVNGFYRFFATYQRQLDPYLLNQITSDTALARTIFIGDDAQLPNLLLNVAGKTSDKTSWGFDIMMFQFLNGALGSSYGKQVSDSLRPNVQTPLLGHLRCALVVYNGLQCLTSPWPRGKDTTASCFMKETHGTPSEET